MSKNNIVYGPARVNLTGSLAKYDREEWLFQKEHKTMVEEKYNHLYLNPLFFRFSYSDVFIIQDFIDIEASICSSSYYIYEKIYESVFEYISTLIPNMRVVPYGESAFKKIENDMFIDNSELRCGGLEKEYEHLTRFFIKDLFEDIMFDARAISKELDKFSFEIMDLDNKQINFIVGGIGAANQIFFETLIKDLNKTVQPIGILENKLKLVIKKYENIVYLKYREIIHE